MGKAPEWRPGPRPEPRGDGGTQGPPSPSRSAHLLSPTFLSGKVSVKGSGERPRSGSFEECFTKGHGCVQSYGQAAGDEQFSGAGGGGSREGLGPKPGAGLW